MMPPTYLPRGSFALIDFLVRQGWLRPLDGDTRDSTTDFVVRSNHEAHEYLQRASAGPGERCPESLAQADRFIVRALERVDGSGRYELLSWREHQDGGKIVRTFGEKFDKNSSGRVPYRSIFKQHNNGGLPDTDKIRRVGILEEVLYYARLDDPSVPAVEISAYTTRFLISIRLGENLAYEVIPRTASEEHERIAQRVVGLIEGLSAFTLARPQLTEGAEPERVEKVIRCAADIAAMTGATSIATRACGDAERLAQAVRAEGLTMPHYDPKSPNLMLEDDGTLRLIDLDNAVTMLTAPGIVRAHAGFDPLLDLTLERRLDLAGSLDSAIYYTIYRSARAIARGTRVPYPGWVDTANRRGRGHLENMRTLLEMPEARQRYPALAELSRHIDPQRHAAPASVTRAGPTSPR